VETGALTRERGAYRLTRPIQAMEVPATVQVIPGARIDRLPAEDKQLLQTASVIGKTCLSCCSTPSPSWRRMRYNRRAHASAGGRFLYETRLFPIRVHLQACAHS